MQYLRSMLFIIAIMAGPVLANNQAYVGMLPEIEVTALRYNNEDVAWSGLMPEVTVTAPRPAYRESGRQRALHTVTLATAKPAGQSPAAYQYDARNIQIAGPGTIIADPAALKFSGDYYLPDTDTVADDITITSGNAQIDGVIKGDLAVLGGTVNIKGMVKGDVAVMGGNLDLFGTIDGDAAVFGGNIKNRGAIKGDLHVVGGTVYLDSASVVQGNISMVGGTVERDENAVVEGKIESVEIKALEKILPRISRTFRLPGVVPGVKVFPRVMSLGMLAVLFVLNILIVLIFPAATEYIAEEIKQSVWASLGLGIALQILFIPLIILFAVSIIGIPLIVFLPLAVFVAALFGIAALALVVGERVSRGFGWKVDTQAGRFSLGWLALMLIPIIVTLIGTPILVFSWFVYYFVVTIGTGSVIYALITRRKKAPVTA
ncbi:polymer-forming cytoskeletal protein [candidate division WOR-3 bacterium]|nr:polymer-forming cytoskeletal protein [candidate division WOR-3 bacterium]